MRATLVSNAIVKLDTLANKTDKAQRIKNDLLFPATTN